MSFLVRAGKGHVISIKWRKNDETKHLITYQLPFSPF